MDKDLLYKYFMGNATTEEGMAVKQWMEASADNRKAFARERRMFDAMLLTDVSAPAARRSTVSRRIGMMVLKAASVAAVVLLAVVLYGRYTQRPDTLAVVSVPAGQHTRLTLPDGTAVWLNARSEIRYSTSFNNKHRDVQLSGEAYFEVAKNKKLPFVVHANDIVVKATGTTFDVQAYPENHDFEVALIEGGVDVYSIYMPDRVVHLKAGDKVSGRRGQLAVTAIEHEEDYRWRCGLICFRNERVDGIMRQFEKSFGIRINIHNRKVLEHTYTGKFRQNDGVDYALKVLQRDISFKYVKDDERGTVDIY